MGDLAAGRIQQRISCWETVCLRSTTGARGLDTDDRFNVCGVCVCAVLPDHLESILPDPAAIWVRSRIHVRSATI
ncbi:hypothetical protein QQF64_016798 [Cirrhinus molitorella]|uniref:Uncharacterized protein n=1 Tax=Cirrhinus molitorella TaxID=172907 RepID=A0ABR3LNT3_9TELE